MKPSIKLLGLLAIVACFSPSSRAAVTVTKLCSSNTAAAGQTVSCTMAGTTTTADVLVIMSYETNTPDTATFSDGGTNTYTATAASPCSLSANRNMYIAYKVNSTSVTNATFTVTWTGSGNTRDIVVAEISGLANGGRYANSTCRGAVVSSVADPGAANLNSANYAILEKATGDVGTTTGATFTLLSSDNGEASQYKVITGGTWGVSAFATSQNSWIAAGSAFTDGPAAGTGGGGVGGTGGIGGKSGIG